MTSPVSPVRAFPIIPEYSVLAWLRHMQRVWLQGEHAIIIGQTGTGKTTVARSLLTVRDYVIALLLKQKDRVAERYTRDFPKYKKFTSWPIRPGYQRALVWIKPENLEPAAIARQSAQVHTILNDIYLRGGWAIFLDDTGYITGTLKRTQDVVILLNQARSSYISVVAAATQPTSVAARIPSETMRQVRHYIIFKYRDETSIKSLAMITGIPYKEMEHALSLLKVYPNKTTDFLYVSNGEIMLIRNPPVRQAA